MYMREFTPSLYKPRKKHYIIPYLIGEEKTNLVTKNLLLTVVTELADVIPNKEEKKARV